MGVYPEVCQKHDLYRRVSQSKVRLVPRRSSQAFVYGLKGKRLIHVETIDIEKYSSELGGQGELTAAEGHAAW